MITGLRIRGFKRFADRNFAIAPLTVLTGLNGSGKTTLIHALLLAREACGSPEQNVVSLNGPFSLALGTAEDVRNWAADDTIEFLVSSTSLPPCKWELGVPAEEALYLTIEEKPNVLPVAFHNEPRAFTYLCAERLGPRATLGASPLPSHELEIGVRGENCAQMLAALGDKPMKDQERLHPNRVEGDPTFLKYEVEKWLAEIVRPIEIDATLYPGSAVTAMRFRTPGGEWVTAPNMGFGVSYAFPILLAGLTANSGGVIIIENPEAHLHPAGQSRLGVFLAWLAGRGVQVIVETHSDHILNGIRRAIGEFKYLDNEAAVVHFLDSARGLDNIHSLKFSPIGGISDWPSGFFDQYQVDTASLGRIRRKA